MRLKRRHTNVPALQMAAMPDLIFTVLFFFMIVTHMRENTVKVECQQPEGKDLVRVTNKAAVINIYLGRDLATGDYKVQVENDIVGFDRLPQVLREAADNVPADQEQNIAASLQADRQTPMLYIYKVKKALREAGILKVRHEGIDSGEASTKDPK